MADTTYTSLAEMDEALMKIIGNYRTRVLEAMEKGAEEGANLFIKEAQKVSPPFEGTSKGSPRYRDCWAIKNRPKAKYVRSVGNSKKVKGKNNTNIPLINILEFSTVRGRPHVAKAVQNSAGQILELFQSKLES
jgi:hypothetical protein